MAGFQAHTASRIWAPHDTPARVNDQQPVQAMLVDGATRRRRRNNRLRTRTRRTRGRYPPLGALAALLPTPRDRCRRCAELRRVLTGACSYVAPPITPSRFAYGGFALQPRFRRSWRPLLREKVFTVLANVALHEYRYSSTNSGML